jgi:hypothetical protein
LGHDRVTEVGEGGRLCADLRKSKALFCRVFENEVFTFGINRMLMRFPADHLAPTTP